ncbi:MAG: hypothetical protein ABI760_00695 [Ferruginibacter sp.]
MKILFAALLLACAIQLSAQYTFFEPKEAFAIEVSLDHSPLKRLPIYRNSISSLIVSGDHIIGGTTADEGLTPFIFTASLAKRELVSFLDLNETIPGQKSIRSGFSKGKNNWLYAGTLANKNDKDENQDGHLIEVRVDADGASSIKDLGAPIPGEGIFSLTAGSRGTMLYGITYPTGIFFTYNIATKAVKTFKDIIPSTKDLHSLSEYVLNPEDWLCKALVEGPNGQIFGSLPINKLFFFDPATQRFHIFEDHLPEVWGRRTLGQVESWAKSKDGKLYGGNAGDGQLFEINPVNKKVKNLGKPIMMPGLRGLAFARDGKLYGIAGGLPGYAHLFSYAPNKEGFRDYGNPQFTMKAPGIEQGIDWRGFQLGTITSSPDGKYIVMGEDESLSHLLVFAVDTMQ